MEQLVANVLANNFWEVKKDGKKLAFIHETPVGYTLKKTDLKVFSNKNVTENFPSMAELITKYQIRFDTPKKCVAKQPKPNEDTTTLFGYPINSLAYNKIFDYKNGLPLYTKTPKSKSYFCAGWYAIQNKNVQDCDLFEDTLDPKSYSIVYNPKIILLQRSKFHGPYKTMNAVPQKFSNKS